MKRFFQSTTIFNLAGLVIAWLGIFAFFAWKAPPAFHSIDNFKTMAQQDTIVAIATLGMTCIIICGGIDLSVGSVVAFVTVVIALLLQAKQSPWVALSCGVLAGGAWGFLNGVLITRLKVVPFIVTLGTFLFVRGAAKGLAKNRTVDSPDSWLNELTSKKVSTASWHLVPPGVWLTLAIAAIVVVLLKREIAKSTADGGGGADGKPRSDLFKRMLVPIYVVGTALVGFQMLQPEGREFFKLLPTGVWITILAAILVALMLKRTRFGRHIVAVGSNEQAARLCGVPVERVKVAVYLLSGLLVGMAGLMQYSRLTLGDPTAADGLELKVIAAVVIGGASLNGGQGSILGSLLGAWIMTTISTGCAMMSLDNWVEQMVTGAIIVISVAIDRLRVRRD